MGKLESNEAKKIRAELRIVGYLSTVMAIILWIFLLAV